MRQTNLLAPDSDDHHDSDSWSTRMGQVFFYRGAHVVRFADVFGEIGTIVEWRAQ